MNWDTIAGNWKQFQGKARQQWGKLTDDDLELVKGKRDELAGRIQERYGIAKDEAERQIDDWSRTSELGHDHHDAARLTIRHHRAADTAEVAQAASAGRRRPRPPGLGGD